MFLHVRAHGRCSTASLYIFYEILDVIKNPAFDLDPLRPHAYAAPIAQRAFGTGKNMCGFFGDDECWYFHCTGLPSTLLDDAAVSVLVGFAISAR